MAGNALTVGPDASISEAIDLMQENCLSGIPVVDAGGELVGILTEGDLLRRVETGTERRRAGWLDLLLGADRAAEQYVRTHARRVADVMTRDVVTVTEDMPLDEVVALMERKHVKRLPVLRQDKIVGIVSRADLVRAVGRALQDAGTGPERSEAIRKRLYADLQSESWFRSQDITAEVNDGVVTLSGVISNEAVRTAVRVAASNVPGVRSVEDKLVWVEPAAAGTMF